MVKEPQSCTDHLADTSDGMGQDLIWYDLVVPCGQTLLQAFSPSKAQLGVDVDNIDSGANGRLEIIIRGSRAAVQS